MKTFVTIIFCFCTSLAFSQTDKDKFVGRWVSSDAGYEMECNFKADGTGIVDGDAVKWSVKPGFLIVEVEGERKSYNYVFNDKGFRVSGGDLDMPLNFRRVQDGGTASTNATSKNSAGKKLDQSLVGKWCYVNVTSNYSS